MSNPSPKSRFRKLAAASCLTAALLSATEPAFAQSVSGFALRDTETEEMLRSYETPLGRAAGLFIVPVSMPKHFLLRLGEEGAPEELFIDAFDCGRLMSRWRPVARAWRWYVLRSGFRQEHGRWHSF